MSTDKYYFIPTSLLTLVAASPSALLTFFLIALSWSSALNGALQMGQLLAWYLRESAQPLHKHRCLQGSISVSRMSDMHITHSAVLSSNSSSSPVYNNININNNSINNNINNNNTIHNNNIGNNNNINIDNKNNDNVETIIIISLSKLEDPIW